MKINLRKEIEDEFIKEYGDDFMNIQDYKKNILIRYGFKNFKNLVKKKKISSREIKIFGLFGCYNIYNFSISNEDIEYKKLSYFFGSKFNKMNKKDIEELIKIGFENILEIGLKIEVINDDFSINKNNEVFNYFRLNYFIKIFKESNGNMSSILSKYYYDKEYRILLKNFGHNFYKMSSEKIDFLIEIGSESILELFVGYKKFFKKKDFIDFYQFFELEEFLQFKNRKNLFLKFGKELINLLNNSEWLFDLKEEIDHIKNKIGIGENDNELFLKEYGYRFSSLSKNKKNDLIKFGFKNFKRKINSFLKKGRIFNENEDIGNIYKLFLELNMNDEEHIRYKRYQRYLNRYGNLGGNKNFLKNLLDIDFDEFEKKVGFINDDLISIKGKIDLYHSNYEQLNKINDDGNRFYCVFCKKEHFLKRIHLNRFIKLGVLSCEKQDKSLYNGKRSTGEIELFNYVKGIIKYKGDVIENNKKIYINEKKNKRYFKEIDIFLKDQRKGIEFNGVYFHSGDEKQTLKRNFILSKKIDLFFVWEDLWNSKKKQYKFKIKRFLGVNKRLKDHSYEIKELNEFTTKKFIDRFELKNENNIGEKSLGLFIDGKLKSLINYSINKFKYLIINYFTYIESYSGDLELLIDSLNNKEKNIKKIILNFDNEFGDGKELLKLGFKKNGEIEKKKIYTSKKGEREIESTSSGGLFIYDYGFDTYEKIFYF